MPRALRHEYPGAVYHVMARGDGGKAIFEGDDDRKAFLFRLGQVCGSHGWRVHAWVLMGNHFHLLLETPEPNLVTGMKWLLGTFSQGRNARRSRRGHVFQGRYKAVPVSAAAESPHWAMVRGRPRPCETIKPSVSSCRRAALTICGETPSSAASRATPGSVPLQRPARNPSRRCAAGCSARVRRVKRATRPNYATIARGYRGKRPLPPPAHGFLFPRAPPPELARHNPNANKTDYSACFPAGFEAFALIEDPRDGGNTRHHFGEIIFLSFAALLCGARSYELMEEFCELREPWLRKWLPLPNGVPSANTFSRVFQAIEPFAFAFAACIACIACIASHLTSLGFAMAAGQIAIDGKALRGSRSGELSHVHAVSAWACDAGITLAQAFVGDKSNEITAIPELLAMLNLKGCVVTIDAMGTQRSIAADIVAGGGYYILCAKGNQGRLNDEVREQFDFAIRHSPARRKQARCGALECRAHPRQRPRPHRDALDHRVPQPGLDGRHDPGGVERHRERHHGSPPHRSARAGRAARRAITSAALRTRAHPRFWDTSGGTGR